LLTQTTILFIAPPSDDETRKEALEIKNKKPDDFESIAKSQSACSSAKIGGYLGQTTPF